MFVPFGVETLGPWGPEARRLFKDLSSRLVDVSGDLRAGSYLGQRISLAIERGELTEKMESPRKFNDCYFYYYSTCTKGDNCVFRHEPSALGCETMCVQWQQGKCLDKRCKLRHMELRKNRKQIPCYWESQPGGCRKKHCPFQHKNPEARTDGIAPSQPVPLLKNSSAGAPSCVETEPALAPVPAPHPAPHAPQAPGMVMSHQLLWQQQPRQVVLDSAILGVMPASELMGRRVPPAPHDPAAVPPYASMPVDPLVVNFEEESDNESAPSDTPTKTVSPDEGHKVTSSKSQELILLEQIQAEAAAYYSYDADMRPLSVEPALLLPERRTVRTKLNSQYERLSLDEISGRPRAPDHIRRNSLDFKILSLDEIRARKRASEPQVITTEQNAGKKRKLSTHDTMLAPDKVIKVVRSNSVVYKKVDSAGSATNEISVSERPDNSRKRTRSTENDVFVINDKDLDEGVTIGTNLPHTKIRKLDDQCQEIKLKLICSSSESEESIICDTKVSDTNLNVEEASVIASSVIVVDDNTADIDLDTETDEGDLRQPIVVSDEDSLLEIVASDRECEVSQRDTVGLNEETPSNKVSNLTKILEDGSNDSITSEIEKSLKSGNVPDVVASCHGDKYNVRIDQKEAETKVLIETDEILNEDSL